jgi:hypothetical protein
MSNEWLRFTTVEALRPSLPGGEKVAGGRMRGSVAFPETENGAAGEGCPVSLIGIVVWVRLLTAVGA